MEKNYMDPTLSPERRAELLLREMTTAEKLAQLTGVMAIRGREGRMGDFLKNGIGQISTLDFRNRETYVEAAAWQRQLQEIVMNASRLHIPAVFHMEGLCGPLMQGGVSFPSGIGRGASFHPETEAEIGAIVSRQELACGITQILAPVLDVARDPRMGRYCEPYGEDPTLVSRMGAAYTAGIQENEVDGRRADATAKHFCAFHYSQGGIHGANVEAGDPMMREVFAKPFEAAIRKSHLRGIMPCYCSIDGLPMHASKKYLTKMLREDIGFDGVAVSDYSGVSNTHSVQNVGETMADAGLRCLAAGTDVELPMPKAYSAGLLEKFESGEADRTILDRAVLRVLTAKFRMGLFEHPFAMEGGELAERYTKTEADRAVTLRAARESIVLLKNNGVLPLKKGIKKIALIGPHAVNARSFFGGYTDMSMVEAVHAAANSMAGTGGGGSTKNVEMLRVPGTSVQLDETETFEKILKWLNPDCRNLYEELTARLPEAEILHAKGYYIFGADESRSEEALEVCRDADLVILTLGGKNGSGSIATMGEGVDGTDINLPAAQDAFIEKARTLGKPMIGVHLDGRPISSDVADRDLDAILECWSPAECGAEAIVDVLTGKVNPSGKLPVSVAYGAGQLPVWYNHMSGSEWHQGPSIGFADYVDMPHTPRYPFGFGLSYTAFEYSDLAVSIPDVAPDGAVEISLTVKNTGSVSGAEVVQLYVRDRYASMVRPVQELAGFTRVDLDPGEEQRVTFSLSPRQLAFLDEDGRWLVEKGDIDVMVGSSSQDIRLSGEFHVSSSKHIESAARPFWAEVK